MGYHRAGFDVVGIDLNPQPFYPFTFIQADAMNPPVRLQDFDAIHASPPCQGYSEGGRRYPEKQAQQPKLIEPTRYLLEQSGRPYIIENVMGARWHLVNPVTICAGAVGLPRLKRHRLFETNWPLLVGHCCCRSNKKIGVYGDRPDGRILNSRYPSIRAAKGLEDAQDAMGMDWADWHGTKEAIPPNYTEFIGSQLIAQLENAA